MGRATFKKGDQLMVEGERGDTFFILRAGITSVAAEVASSVLLTAGVVHAPQQRTLKLHRTLAGTCNVTMGRRSVRDLNPGDGFGEIALIYNQPRTATVTATADCEVFMMNRSDASSLIISSQLSVVAF